MTPRLIILFTVFTYVVIAGSAIVILWPHLFKRSGVGKNFGRAQSKPKNIRLKNMSAETLEAEIEYLNNQIIIIQSELQNRKSSDN